MEIPLHDQVACAGELEILGADEQLAHGGLAGRVFGSIDKPQVIASVEITEAVHLIDQGKYFMKLKADRSPPQATPLQ